jgi:hypothetical protein
MTPYIGTYDTNLQNLWYFSPCSIKSFKALLLDNTTVSTKAQCLLNVPSDLPDENTYFNTFLPGQLLTLDQQCKMATGYKMSWSDSTNPLEICSEVYCLYPDGKMKATPGKFKLNLKKYVFIKILSFLGIGSADGIF